MDRKDASQREAITALVKLAVFEGAALLAVVGMYLVTGSMLHLVLGLGVVSVLFAPLFVRRVLDLRAAQEAGTGPQEAGGAGAASAAEEPPSGSRWE